MYKRLNRLTERSEVLMAAVFVTTLDNPFDYFTQFDEWYAFDTQKGYNTCNYLARIANTSNDLSEKDYEFTVEEAVDEICRLNITGNYRKVYDKREKEDKKTKEE